MSAFDDATLVQDADLSNWESKMPALATKANVLAGKRTISKIYLAKQLLMRGVDPALLTDPMQLTDAACFKELELVYQDMSCKENSIAGEKSDYYGALFKAELELIILNVTSAAGNATTVRPTISSVPLART